MSRPSSILRQGIFLVSAPILFQAFFAVLLWLQQRAEVEADDEHERTKQILLQVQLVQGLLYNSESAIRGFAVTGEARFAAPYREAAEQLPMAALQLRNLVGADPGQQARAARIQERIDRVLELHEAKQKDLQLGRRDAVIARIKSGAGLELMDEIRRDFVMLTAQVQRDAAERLAQRDALHARFPWLIGGSLALAAAVSLMLALVFQRQIAGRLAAVADNTVRLVEGRVLAPPLEGNDEIGRLDAAFRSMAARVRQSEETLQQFNRELAQHVADRTSELQESEQRLRESADRLHVIIDNMSQGVVFADAQGNLFHWNRAALKMCGFASMDGCLLALPEFQKFFELTTLDGQPVAFHDWPLPRILRGERVRDLELRLRRLDQGWEKVCSYGGDMVTDLSGRQVGFLTIQDITERAHAQEALRQSEERARALIEQSIVGFYRIEEGRFSYVNPRLCDILGYRAEELTSRPLFDFIAPEDHELVRENLRKRLDGGVASLHYALRMLHRDGRRIDVEVHGARVADQGRPAILGVLMDVSEARKAEAEARQSEARKAAVLAGALDGIITMDGDGRIVEFNPAAAQIFGYGPEAVVGKELAELIVPRALREAHRQGLAKYRQTGTGPVLNQRIEITALRADGSEFPVELTIIVLSENPLMFTGFLRDISERRQAEKRQEQQLARLNLLHQITHAVGEHQDLLSIYRVVLAQLEENLPMDLCSICSYSAATHSLQVTAIGPRSEAFQTQLGLGVGAELPANPRGMEPAVQGSTIYEPNLAEVNAPIASRLAAGGLGSLVATPLRVEGRTLGVLLVARRESHGYTSADCEFLKQLGGHVALAAQHARLYEDLKKAYEDLRQSQKAMLQQERLRALGQMASGIAHDINNTISPIAVYAEALLERETNLSDKARKYLTTIARAIDDVAHTVSRMRDFYRQQEKQLELKTVDLNALVPEVVERTGARWRDQSQRNGVTVNLQTELHPGLPKVMAVESEIRDALTNLIFNGVDAMPQGGSLVIRTRTGARGQGPAGGGQESGDRISRAGLFETTHVILEVEDSGVGMDEETRQRCLEPFYTTKGERGTGLGLAMVYGTMRRHSGDIEIDSAPGRGTTMRLLFLLPQAPLSDRPSWSGTERPLAPRRILVIDDDALVRRSLQDALTEDGHQVVQADGGQQGVEVFRAAQASAAPFDVVLTDLGMPHMDGRAVAEAIKRLSSTTAVILLTGWGQRMKSEGDYPAYVDRVLAKPPKLREVRDALFSLFGPGAENSGDQNLPTQ